MRTTDRTRDHGQEDRRLLDAAAALARRGLGLARPNPAVGAILVRDGRIVGRGHTQPGGRPHAEAAALAMAGAQARGATLYVTLEPCAHVSARGPACAELVRDAGLARVVIGCTDPDPRTAGKGIARLRASGITVEVLDHAPSRRSLEGYLLRQRERRPHVTLKLALSLDGRIALPSGESRWITGPEARAHVHALRARSEAILVGGGTLRADSPRLDVRLAGLEARSPERWVLTQGEAPPGWRAIRDIAAPGAFGDLQCLFVEGGAGAAATFLAADRVDRLVIVSAPIVIGAGRPSVGDIGLPALDQAHGRWQRTDMRALGSDMLAVYERVREGE